MRSAGISHISAADEAELQLRAPEVEAELRDSGEFIDRKKISGEFHDSQVFFFIIWVQNRGPFHFSIQTPLFRTILIFFNVKSS